MAVLFLCVSLKNVKKPDLACVTRISYALKSGQYIHFFVNLFKNTLAQAFFPVLRLTKDCVFVSEISWERRGFGSVNFKCRL